MLFQLKTTVSPEYFVTDCLCKPVFILTRPSLATATPKSRINQHDKAELRNYIVSLSKSSGQEYSRNVRWLVHGIAAFPSVPPRATYEK